MVSNIRTGQPATLNKCGMGGRRKSIGERVFFFLEGGRLHFPFFLTLLAGSEPVVRRNKQSKEASWWISYLIKGINTNPRYLCLESVVHHLNLLTTTRSVPQLFIIINIILQFYCFFFIFHKLPNKYKLVIKLRNINIC